MKQFPKQTKSPSHFSRLRRSIRPSQFILCESGVGIVTLRRIEALGRVDKKTSKFVNRHQTTEHRKVTTFFFAGHQIITEDRALKEDCRKDIF